MTYLFCALYYTKKLVSTMCYSFLDVIEKKQNEIDRPNVCRYLPSTRNAYVYNNNVKYKLIITQLYVLVAKKGVQ